tara:strand:- start:2514 stop:2867 length:354 start_codon:yes stop_codon:yes gene_type:complete
MAQKPYEYDFCNVPNTKEGKLFIKLLSKFRNKDKISRVDTKGQKLKDGKSWEDYPYGYPVKDSQTLRVYLRRTEPKTQSEDYRNIQFDMYRKGYKDGKDNAYENIRQLATDELNRSV